MGYEIDFLPVGDGEKGGDAIVLRIGDLHGKRENQNVIVIDGGTKESGKQIIEHIKKYYNTDVVDTVICSHLHSDHASGLTEVLENLKVNKLLMHLPWEHSDDIKNMFTDGRLTAKGLNEKMEKSLTSIKNLEELAQEKNIPIIEPFAGLSIHEDGTLTVIGPSEDYYKELLANCEFLPKVREEFSILEKAKDFGQKIINWISETIDMATETLDDSGETSCENNTSTIILFKSDDKRALFTGDAGIPALTKAIEHASSVGVDLNNLDFLDVPHHGSKRNIGKTLLNYLMPKMSFISAPVKGDPKHPSRKVINALKRRKSSVVATKGKKIWHFNNAPVRSDYGPAVEEPLHTQVED